MENIKLVAYKLISLDKIPSTQIWAHDLIANNTATDKTVIVANSQTSGHGRYGRKWISHSGNLYASFIYKIKRYDPKISYSIAVAVAETLIYFGVKPKIKWPNDILIDGKKVSGILIEYDKNFVIIGIGIDVNHAPKLLEYQTAKMNDFVKVSMQELLSMLIKKIDLWRNADFEKVRERWQDLAVGINQEIKYRTKQVKMIGLDNSGALVLNDGNKDILIYGAEL